MIQRIQTIFFILAAVAFAALFKLPFATSNKASAQFLADSVYDIHDHPALLGLTILGSLVSLIVIFVYKNRRLQVKLGYIVMLLGILLPLTAFLLFTNESAAIDPTVVVNDHVGMFLPGAAIVFGVLANYYIRKDDRLVKSMDRLR